MIKNGLVTLTFIFIFSSCGEDLLGIDACNSATYDEEVPAILTSFTTALQSYGSNPSDANCQALRNEYSSYLNFLKDYEDCAFTFNGGELSEVIRQGEMDIEELPCS